jgi:hypothetical protein
MKQIPWKPNMTPEEKRVRHNARLIEQGWRLFRIDSLKGHIILVREVEDNMAYGETLRGFPRKAMLDRLYPMPLKED